MTPGTLAVARRSGPHPRVSLLVPALFPNDAIGTDVVRMRETLAGAGYPVKIFADTIHRDYAHIARPLHTVPKGYWGSRGDILIYHHAVGWRAGERVLFTTRNRLIVRHHNVTPPHFFARYSAQHVRACEAGAECSRRIACLRDLTVLGDSSFNCSELVAMGASPDACRVLAPLHSIEELGRAPFDIPTIERYADGAVNLLFVGGVKPNKGHAGAIRILAEYQRRFNYRSRLIFAGLIEDSFRGYADGLRQMAAGLGLARSVIFTGFVNSSQMKSLYAVADVFLCTSEHEGFCVPLVESMYFRVPIVALARTAVSETVGGAGFLIENLDEAAFASRIDDLAGNLEVASRAGANGRERYLKWFTGNHLRARLMEIVDRVAGVAPPIAVGAEARP